MGQDGKEGIDPPWTKPREGDVRDDTISGTDGDETLISSASKHGTDSRVFSRSFIGKTLGEYRIIREIGHGSMGIVFEARHDGLDRTVALKVLPPSLSVTETVIKRFMREAQSVAKLDHENIVQIYTTGDQDGVYFYAMQFIEGSPLDDVLKERKLSPTESAEIAALSARALFYAHEHSIIHRDVKPANIILSYKDRPVLTDFGLARPEKAATLTASGALVGTPIYMSPEQVRGDRVHIDRRTDIYSLGITFYEMLTGTTPYEAESTQEILNKIEYHDPRPVRKMHPGVPKALETICHKAIEKEAGRRYQTAIEFALDLERFLNGEPIQAKRTAMHTRLIKKAAKHRTITTLGALLALALVLVYFVFRAGLADEKSANTAQYNQLLLEGLGHLRQGESTVAMQKYDQAISLLPKVATGYVDRGKAFYTAAQHESALQDFERALELDPSNVRARMWRNISTLRYGSSEDHGAALVDLQEMLDVSPDDTNLLLEVSKTCLDLADQAGKNDDEVARDAFINSGYRFLAKLRDLDPENMDGLADDAYVIQGLFLEEQGLMEEAHALYDLALAIDKTNVQAMTLRHVDRPEQVQPDDSDADLASAVTGVAPWWTVLGAQGVSWASKQITVDRETLTQAASALALWDSSEEPQEQNPTDGLEIEQLLARAGALWSEDQIAQAAPIYEEVLARNPRLAEPNNRLAQYYLKSGTQDDLAKIHIEQALEVAPTNPKTLLIAMEVYYKTKEIENLKRVVETIRLYYPIVDANKAYRVWLDALGTGFSEEEEEEGE